MSEPPTEKATERKVEAAEVQRLLEPLSRDQLLELLTKLATQYPSVYKEIDEMTGRDASRCKLFVRELAWETTSDRLREVFEKYGELVEAAVVYDRQTGKSKGFGFVTFKTADAASRALEQPAKEIDGRLAQCNLAVLGNPNKRFSGPGAQSPPVSFGRGGGAPDGRSYYSRGAHASPGGKPYPYNNYAGGGGAGLGGGGYKNYRQQTNNGPPPVSPQGAYSQQSSSTPSVYPPSAPMSPTPAYGTGSYQQYPTQYGNSPAVYSNSPSNAYATHTQFPASPQYSQSASSSYNNAPYAAASPTYGVSAQASPPYQQQSSQYSTPNYAPAYPSM